MAVVSCSQCGAELPPQAELKVFLDGKRVCNFKCLHDAGSRAHCGPGCGCTAYAIKRRMLREHRELMRCMESIIYDNGLGEDLGALWQNNRDPRPGRAICLDYDPELDEGSDREIQSSSSAPSWPTEAPCSRLSRARSNAAG